VATESLLREQQLAVHAHLEDATGGLLELVLGIGPSLLQLGHQTGGSGLVVSNDAIFNAYAHGRDGRWEGGALCLPAKS